MRSDTMGIEAGFYQDIYDPGDAERLVLRFTSGEILVSSVPGKDLKLEADIQGSFMELPLWKPSVRRREGLLVLGDADPARVMVSRIQIGVPASFRDLEIHTVAGIIDARDLATDILATAESGDVLIQDARNVEISSVSGQVSIGRVESAIIRSIDGTVRCQDVLGHLAIDTQGGTVEVATVQGNVVIMAESADVEVTDPRSRLRVITKSGDVNLEISTPFGGGEVNTADGDVAVTIASSEIELRCETLSGTINAPGCSVSTTTGPRRCALHLGRGGKRLHVKSVEGDVEVIR